MNEAHERFQDWLTAGAEGDPPRDVAVHASVCAACSRSIAALDLLAVVDPGLATMPAAPTGPERGRMAMAGRLAGATAILFAAAVLGVGMSQLIGVSRHGGPVAQASRSPEQSVLGGTATPEPTPDVTPTPSQETLTPLVTPAPTPRAPVATPVPYVPPPPAPIPTAVPTPVVVPSDTPLPSDTPVPTAIPTPAPTVPGPPTLVSATGGVGVVDLAWSAPASDGGSALIGYEIWRRTASGTEVLYATVGVVLTYEDTTAPAETYFYRVAAMNSVGTGSFSNEMSATTT